MSRRRFVSVVALSLVALPALADAPLGQYQQFDRKSVTITDDKTKLEWQRTVGVPQSFSATAALCSLGTFEGTGGRVPTIKELLTLLDETPVDEYDPSAPNATRRKYIDPQAFPKTPVTQPYWSSTPSGNGKVWTLDFQNGAMVSHSTEDTDKAALRCVR